MLNTNLLNNGTILLRAPEPADLDVLFSMENNTEIWFVSGNAVPYSRYQLKKYIEQSQHDFYTDRQIRFMIVRIQDNAVLGSVDLTDIDPYNGRAEVGIALVSEYREQGFASMALKIVMEYAVKVLRLHQLYCHIPSEHEHSINLFSSNGFIKSGTLIDWLIQGEGYSKVVVLQKIF